MAKFLMTVWPFAGHLNPALAVAAALRQRGHEVAFYTGKRGRPKVEAAGCRCFPFRRLDEERIMRIVAPPEPASWKKPLHFIGALRKWLVEPLDDQIDDIAAAAAQWRPDAVIADITMWGAPLVLHEKRGIPVAVLSYALGCMVPGRDAPPWGMGLPRPRNVPQRVVCAVVRTVSDLLTADIRRAANRIRARHGLRPLAGTIHSHLGTMPLYLVPSVPALDYERRDLPPTVQYVGPLTWSAPRDPAEPKWREHLRRDRPIVHVCEGTLHNGGPFLLKAAIHGLAAEPVEVVVTTANSHTAERLTAGRRSGNIRIERWVPHAELLPVTDVLVTTGGAGTVLTALQAGVPMVLVPTEWDKPDNARRVVEAGAGLWLSPMRCTADRLRHVVGRILSRNSFRQAAARMAVTLSRPGGAPRAARLLESML